MSCTYADVKKPAKPSLTALEIELLALVSRFQDCGGEDSDGENRDFWEDWDDAYIAADALKERHSL